MIYFRTRRIKCDETIPGCVRCLKFGILCSGYPKQPDKGKSKSRPIKSILPKGTTSDVAQESFVELYVGPRFTEELEHSYFNYFCENVAQGITGPLPAGVWCEVIPQVCETELYIANGLVALGAFIKYKKETVKGSKSSGTKKHLQYALSEYGKCLQGIQKAVDGGEGRSPRSALIACLLVFCIESLQGHQAAASAHAMNCVMMLSDSYQSSAADTKFAKENSIGPDLQRAFTGLDLQVLYFQDLRSVAHHVMIKEHLNQHQLRAGLLDSFQTIADCYVYLQAMMRRNLHFIDSARKCHPGADWQEESEMFPPRVEDDAAKLCRTNNVWLQPEERSAEFPPEMLRERDIYLADMIRWEEASADIFQSCLTSPHHSQEFRTAALLKIHAASITICLHGSFYTDEIQYDELFPYFQTIITYCTFVHPYYSSSSYHINLGILMPLFSVGMHCRNKMLRDQAIAMTFVNKEYREGVWDCYVGGFICKWIRDLEEPWRDAQGHIPAERRAKFAGLNVAAEKRTSQMFCTQKAGLGKGSVLKNVTVNW